MTPHLHITIIGLALLLLFAGYMTWSIRRLYNLNNHINMSTSCDPAMTINQRDFGPTQSISNLTPSIEAMGHMDKPMCDNTNVGYERLQPDLLDAFKANPYACTDIIYLSDFLRSSSVKEMDLFTVPLL